MNTTNSMNSRNQDNPTIAYYNQNANQFVEGTVDVDMSDIHRQLTKYLPQGAHILDAGCGSGRDSLAFMQMGYEVTAIDGSEELCKRASELIGKPVKHQYFEEINEVEVYDGIWACATLLHVPSERIHQVLSNLLRALKPEGILYMSVKCGEFEGIRNGRHFTDYTEASLMQRLSAFPELQIIEKHMTEDKRADRAESWINMTLKK